MVTVGVLSAPEKLRWKSEKDMKLKKKQRKKVATKAASRKVARRFKRRAACSADGRVMSLVRNRGAASTLRRKIRDSGRDEVLERFERGQSVADFIDFSAGKFVKIS